MQLISTTLAYCLLDAARMRDTLEEAKFISGPLTFACLYKGVANEQFSNVAPYLFVAQSTAFAEWLFAKGWGDYWGVLALSRADEKAVYNHFRRFLMVNDEKGQSLYFRFYDPRVLRQFLPTCEPAQSRQSKNSPSFREISRLLLRISDESLHCTIYLGCFTGCWACALLLPVNEPIASNCPQT